MCDYVDSLSDPTLADPNLIAEHIRFELSGYYHGSENLEKLVLLDLRMRERAIKMISEPKFLTPESISVIRSRSIASWIKIHTSHTMWCSEWAIAL